MKHTCEHTCETAIYHEQSPDLIRDKCNIQYYPKLDPTPQIIDAEKHILLGNIPEPRMILFLTLLKLVNILLSRRNTCVSVLLVQVHGTCTYCSL